MDFHELKIRVLQKYEGLLTALAPGNGLGTGVVTLRVNQIPHISRGPFFI